MLTDANVDWGTPPSWVSAVAAAIALIFAARTYRLNSVERQQKQARLVWVDADVQQVYEDGQNVMPPPDTETSVFFPPGTTRDVAVDGETCSVSNGINIGALVVLHNNSEELVLRWQPLPKDFITGERIPLGLYLNAVSPGQTGREGLFLPSSSYVLMGVRFQDSSGRIWEREPGGPIRPVRSWNVRPGIWWGTGRLRVRIVRGLLMRDGLPNRLRWGRYRRVGRVRSKPKP